MVETGDSAPGAMGKSDFCAINLSVASLAPQLTHNLDDLRRTGRADWMAFRQQPTGRVHRNTPADRGFPVF